MDKRFLTATLLVLLLAAAGCSSPPKPAVQPVAPPTADPTPEPSEAPSPAGRLDTRVESESRTNFDLGGCLNPRMLFFLEPAQAQALLPPGFKAADATGLVQFTGLPVGSPVPSGKAVGGYDFLSCANNTLDGAPVAFSQVGILVQPPDLGDRTPTDAATYDLYLLALHSDRPAWHSLALASGFNPEEAPLAAIASAFDDQGAGNGLGTGAVTASAALASAEYVLPAAGRELDLQARYWHLAANGTAYFDFHLHETVRAGSITACAHAAGSAFEKVTGTQSCAGEPRFAAVGTGTRVAGTAYWLPGVVPR